MSINVPKALKNLLRQSLVARNGNFEAKQDLTKALETALGCSIRNFNCVLSKKDGNQLDSKPPNNNFEPKTLPVADLHRHQAGTISFLFSVA